MKKLIHTTTRSLDSIKTLISNGHYSQALKATTNTNTNLTDQTYALFIKSGHTLDPFLSTHLISHFSKIGDLSRTNRFLHDTPNPDIVTYNALLSGYAKFCKPRIAFQLFDKIRLLGLSPDVFTMSSLIKSCGCLEENEVSHGVCLRLGFGSGAYLVSGLIENYARNGDVRGAERCFEECLVVDNVVWTAMVCGYVWNGEFEKGRMVFREMRGLGLVLNEFSLTSVLGAVFGIQEGEQVHCFGVKTGLLCGCSVPLNNSLMNMYCKFGCNRDAIRVFDEIGMPDIVSWTERIAAASCGREAIELFQYLHSEGMQMNEYIITSVFTFTESEDFLNIGKQIQAFCHKAGHQQAVCLSNALISLYGNCGLMDEAKLIFDENTCRDSVSWNSLISGYSDNGLTDQAFEVFHQMQNELIQPNTYTMGSILELASYNGCPRQTMQIHAVMFKYGFMFDTSMASRLITTYGKCLDVDSAKRVYKDIESICVLHLNAMATTYFQTGYYADAMNLLKTSRNLDVEMDSTTFSIALKVCSAATDLEQGRSIHSLALKCGFAHDSFVQTAIVDVYCKCGSIVEAEKAFRYVDAQNLATWNAMMMGYAHHGFHNEVFLLFDRMHEFGIGPDEISYLGVLTSCCHTGLVKEANKYLKSMFELHGLAPCLEHYACLVDLLGRVGLLEDAKKTIDQMPIQADAYIWQILLSSCNIHRNTELGRVAADKILQLQPDNESAYVLLSNIYASVGMWDNVGKLRKEMKRKVIRKEPGSSWIQVEGFMHYFFAGDMLHPETKAIYTELLRLYMQMLPKSKGQNILVPL